MKITFYAKITYKLKENHPDFECIPEPMRSETHEFEDVYNVDPDYFFDLSDIRGYIKHDLRLIAGGGYRTDTIKDVSIEIKGIPKEEEEAFC